MRLTALFAALVLSLCAVACADPAVSITAPAAASEWPMQPCPRC